MPNAKFACVECTSTFTLTARDPESATCCPFCGEPLNNIDDDFIDDEDEDDDEI